MADTATKIPFAEAAAPSTPASGKVVVYAKSDGLMYSKDDAGAETLMSSGTGGSVATDAIWDAAGDLAVGSGSNTAARLAIGATNGMALMRVSGSVAWALPPGHEFDYAQITSPVTVSSTTEATPTNIVSGNSVTYDGSTAVIIEFFTCEISCNTASVINIINLWDGSTDIGRIAKVRADISTDRRVSVYARVRLTPSAAAHTYHIKGWNGGASTTSVDAGAGGAGTAVPAYIRITKA